jgi:hypothetical protein
VTSLLDEFHEPTVFGRSGLVYVVRAGTCAPDLAAVVATACRRPTRILTNRIELSAAGGALTSKPSSRWRTRGYICLTQGASK